MAQAGAAPPSGSLVTNGWVIDASVTMPWFFPDEATPFTERVLDSLGEQVIWAPSLWVLECTNVLQSAQRRRRIDARRRGEVAAELGAFPCASTPKSRTSLASIGSQPHMD